jgi:hypothetical protein
VFRSERIVRIQSLLLCDRADRRDRGQHGGRQGGCSRCRRRSG